MSNYKIIKAHHINEISSDITIYEHIKTKARVCCVKNSDENKMTEEYIKEASVKLSTSSIRYFDLSELRVPILISSAFGSSSLTVKPNNSFSFQPALGIAISKIFIFFP